MASGDQSARGRARSPNPGQSTVQARNTGASLSKSGRISARVEIELRAGSSTTERPLPASSMPRVTSAPSHFQRLLWSSLRLIFLMLKGWRSSYHGRSTRVRFARLSEVFLPAENRAPDAAPAVPILMTHLMPRGVVALGPTTGLCGGTRVREARFQDFGFGLSRSAEDRPTVRRDPSSSRRRRQAEGGTPTNFLKARLKAASDP